MGELYFIPIGDGITSREVIGRIEEATRGDGLAVVEWSSPSGTKSTCDNRILR